MPAPLRSILVAAALCICLVIAQGDPELEGTWTTKSRKVVTGPGFYDPVNEKMFEPDLTGISYSFTSDGFYEEAYYRAVSNRACQLERQSMCLMYLTEFELFKRYEVQLDDYSKAQRLNLYKFDGSPMNPMYLAYKPPQMLPTQTLNPTAASTTGGTQSTGKAKRDLIGDDHVNEPLNKHVLIKRKEPFNADQWWWFGLGMTTIGGIAYYYF
ncbi:MAG: hypothetical protein Q9163_004310 [Psora crenata]